MVNDAFERQPFTKIMKQKNLILIELKKIGCRITKQRILIIDIILENDCSCCKEIFYQASKVDSSIGIATVYRMLKTLEEIGAIDRKNLYRISYEGTNGFEEGCKIVLKSKETIQLSSRDWRDVLKEGLRAKGFLENDEIDSVVMNNCCV